MPVSSAGLANAVADQRAADEAVQTEHVDAAGAEQGDAAQADESTAQAAEDKAAKPKAKTVKADQKTSGAQKAAKAADKGKKKERAKNTKPSIFQRILAYFADVRQEMKRVTWPTKDDIVHSSLIVVAALVFFGVLIYLVDAAMVPILYQYSLLG